MKILSTGIFKHSFLRGISALDELQFDTGEQRHLSEQLLKSSKGCTVPFIVGLRNILLI